MGSPTSPKYRLAVFASGNGTNAERLIQHFAESDLGRIVRVFSDNPEAGVLERARKQGVDAEVLPKKVYNNGTALLSRMHENQIDFIVLAGYLKLVPDAIVAHFPKAIVNIHPALLPNYGGKGMYGMRVHRAVLRDRQTRSGITIHYVNEVYDEGEIILQEAIDVQDNWTAEDLAKAIHQLEYAHFPATIEKLLAERNALEALKYE